MRRLASALLIASLALGCASAARAGGPLGLDHAVAPTDRGIWARRDTLGLEFGVVAVDVGGALWLGGAEPLGWTFWQSLDAEVFGQLAAQAGKYAFGRQRPSQTSNPDSWFHGLKAQSFPSGEVTLQASFVTPFVVQYGARQPLVWALELLPAYDAAARVKEGAHWQSDVLAGWALGSAVGYFATRERSPFFLELLPRGARIGWRASVP